eukprot:jgi/Chlat1/2378/Chrsp17S02645
MAPGMLAALSAPSEVLPRRIDFLPARKPDPQAYAAAGLVPLNAPSSTPAGFSGRKQATELANGQHGDGLFSDSDLQLAWPQPRKVGAGLINLGNTCFMNAVLQCLSYTAPVANFCLAGSHHRQYIAKSFRPGRQEDSHEYARYLIEALHKACLPPGKKVSQQVAETTFVHRVFGGRLQSQVKCMVCHHESNTLDPFLDLSLEIAKVDSLVKALQKFTSPETLDGSNRYKCLRCQKPVRAVKRFSVDCAPNILTIQFKRFDPAGGKMDRHVAFGERLNIRPYMRTSQGGPLEYELYAVLVHAGRSTHSGHYYCFAKSPSGMWYSMDDSRVSLVSQSTVLQQRAYILFYTRRQADKVQQAAPAKTPVAPAAPQPTPLFKTPLAPLSSQAANVSLKNPLAKSTAQLPQPPSASGDKAQAAAPAANGHTKANPAVAIALQANGHALPNGKHSGPAPTSSESSEGDDVHVQQPAPTSFSSPPQSVVEEVAAIPSTSQQEPTDQLDAHCGLDSILWQIPRIRRFFVSLATCTDNTHSHSDAHETKLATPLRSQARQKIDSLQNGVHAKDASDRVIPLSSDMATVPSRSDDDASDSESEQRESSDENASDSESKQPRAADEAQRMHTSLPFQLPDEHGQFGGGVSQWDNANGGDELRHHHQAQGHVLGIKPRKQRDAWDEEYDRGHVKKLKRSSVALMASDDGPNPFQEFSQAKVGGGSRDQRKQSSRRGGKGGSGGRGGRGRGGGGGRFKKR